MTRAWGPRGLAVAVVAAGVIGAAASQGAPAVPQTFPTPEKLHPITFHLYPSTSLQDRLAKDTERTNAKLAQDLVAWRAAKALLPGYEADRETLARTLRDAYAGTYLARPVLWDETGIAHRGWYEVLTHLGTVFPKAHYIHPQSVNVYLEYLPLDGPPSAADLAERYNEAMARNRILDLWFDRGDVDFLASIRTVIAYSPDDAPMELGNELPIPHRKICDPIY